MNKRLITLLSLLIFFLINFCYGQHTFSIVAIDSVTGEIGSAGATCGDSIIWPGKQGAIIISDIIPGVGAIHTQSYWNESNQQNARSRMLLGDTPLQIIEWLENNDFESNPAIRQYGIVGLVNNHTESAAYTGTGCMDYKNHILGPNYAIQGNILLGQSILDSIEARFVNTKATFAERLMAALQGANVAGADSRCSAEGVSSLSAFIRVAKPSDTAGSFYLDLNIAATPYGEEPIDTLQKLFNNWLNPVSDNSFKPNPISINLYPNPAKDKVIIKVTADERIIGLQIDVFDILGNKIFSREIDSTTFILTKKHLSGGQVYIYRIVENDTILTTGRFILF